MIWAAAAGVVAGFMFLPLIGRVLPDSLRSRMAAITVGADRWDAGMSMMAAESPRS